MVTAVLNLVQNIEDNHCSVGWPSKPYYLVHAHLLSSSLQMLYSANYYIPSSFSFQRPSSTEMG